MACAGVPPCGKAASDKRSPAAPCPGMSFPGHPDPGNPNPSPAGNPSPNPSLCTGASPASRTPPLLLRRNWRERLREDCLARVRVERARLLCRLRRTGGSAGGDGLGACGDGSGGGGAGMHAVLSGIVWEVSGARADAGGDGEMSMAKAPPVKGGPSMTAGGAALGVDCRMGACEGLGTRAGAGAGALSSAAAAEDLWEVAVAPLNAREACRQRCRLANGGAGQGLQMLLLSLMTCGDGACWRTCACRPRTGIVKGAAISNCIGCCWHSVYG